MILDISFAGVILVKPSVLGLTQSIGTSLSLCLGIRLGLGVVWVVGECLFVIHTILWVALEIIINLSLF